MMTVVETGAASFNGPRCNRFLAVGLMGERPRFERGKRHLLREGGNEVGIERARDTPMLPDTDMSSRALQSLSDNRRPDFFDDGCVRHNRHVTRGYVHSSSAKLPKVTSLAVTCSHMEDIWDNLSEPHERLRWARMRWQQVKGVKADATAAAESLGMKPHTYRAYERSPDSSKHTELTHQRAISFARKFGVSWEWLMTGKGTPDTTTTSELTPSERRVIDALREAPEARRTAVADAIEQLLKIG